MKKLFLFIAVVLLAAITVNAQNTVLPAFSNSVKTTSISSGTTTTDDAPATTTVQRRCGTMEHLEWMKQQDPTLEARMKAEEQKFNEYVATHEQEILNSKATYTLPVVVHVVYKNTSTGYVSPTRVQEQITQTNSDWAGTNGRSMEAFNTSLRADCGITLCLATKDPNGNTTTGIDYKVTTVTSFGTNDNVKHASTGGADAWDPTKYLNIWVCNMGSSLCGYAQFPSTGINSTYGVVIHYQFFGLTGASAPYNLGGTTSHEFGHCFNLYHIWGDDGGACSGTDYCSDVPNQADAHYGNSSGVVTDACSTSSPGIMYMNFMDYSDDADYANMTPNQSARMQSAISSYLMSVANNASTACATGPAAPVAAFTASATTVTPGTTVAFTDQSTNTPTSWAWSITPGTGWSWASGTASSQNPSVLFSTIGSYTVSLTATNATGSDNETKTSYITVATAASGCDTLLAKSFYTGTCADSITLYVPDAVAPYDSGYVTGQNYYNFPELAMKYQIPGTVVSGTVSDVIVMYALKAGTTGNTSCKIYSSTSGTPGTVLGTSATIVKSAIDTTNWGINYNNVYHFSTPVSVTAASTYFFSIAMPTGWANGTSELAIWGENIECSSLDSAGYLKYGTTWYSFVNAFGVNIDMAILPVVCSGTTDVYEDNPLKDIIVYPNPATDVLNINLNVYGKTGVEVAVYNSMGELVKSLRSDEKTLQIDMSNEVSGIYYVTLVTDEGTITRKVSVIK